MTASNDRLNGLAVVLDTDAAGGIETYTTGLLETSSTAIDWATVRVGRHDDVGRRGQLRAVAEVLHRRSGAPDLILADRLHVLPVGIAARVRAWPGRPRLLVGVYGSELLSDSQHRQKVWAASRTDGLLACSNWTARTARERLGFSGPITVTHPGIDPLRWQRPPGLDVAEHRQRLGLEPAAVYIATIARLEPNARHKGIDRTIAAVARTWSAGIDVRYLIVGGGSDERWVDRHISQAGVGDRVQRIGSASDDGVAEILWASDAFVLPTVPRHVDGEPPAAEGFGISLLEAAAAGVPVITTGMAGAAEAFAEGTTGIRVDGSPESIARAISDLASGRVVIDADAAAGWAAAFSWERRRRSVVEALTGAAAWTPPV